MKMTHYNGNMIGEKQLIKFETTTFAPYYNSKTQMSDYTKISEQRDFLDSKNIFESIAKSYHKNITYTQTPSFHPYDSNLTIKGKKEEKKYAVEVKRIIGWDWENEGLRLKLEKIINIINFAPVDSTPIVLFLCPNCDYYIFDLENYNFTINDLCLWNISKTNYGENKQKRETKLALNFDVENAIYSGKFTPVFVQNNTFS